MISMHRILTRANIGPQLSFATILKIRRFQHNFESEEALELHKASVKKFNKAGFDYEYLFNLNKSQLVYKVIRLQRQVDSYTIMKSVTNVDGRDKIRVDHPEPEDVIDHHDFRLRRVAFKVAYVGWDYMAYAWSDKSDRTVKGHTNIVERVFLESLLRQQLIQGIGWRVNFDRCGRTDRGVSGLSQVICANVRSNLEEGYGVWKRGVRIRNGEEKNSLNDGLQMPVEAPMLEDDMKVPEYLKWKVDDYSQDDEEIPYVSLLNEALPPDIRVLAWSPVRKGFLPRKGCVGRTYRYFFPRGGLDVDLMQKAAQKLVGSHDFRNFAKLSSDSMDRATERSLSKFEIEVMKSRSDQKLPECDICSATITARGFLYRQVRLMMSVLYSIGRGHEDVSLIDRLLDIESTKGRPCYDSMTAAPLIFYNSDYKEDEVCWRWDQKALKTAASVMGEMWGEKAMKAEVLRCIYGHAVERLSPVQREDVKTVVHAPLIPQDGLAHGKKYQDMEQSYTTEDFFEREVRRSVRRLQRKGRYQDAADVKSGKRDSMVGWKF